ncbi:MAG: hypothetical protein Kow00121_49140 [Elainellaceae cyanobacterium]
MKKLAFLLLICVVLVSTLLVVQIQPAQAAFCRQMGDRTICILDIKRSAKNYWEYRASVRIGKQVRPVEVYNCRDRLRIQPDGTVTPFEANGAGELICTTLNR